MSLKSKTNLVSFILKEFGFGKKSIGTIIEEEAQSLVLEDFLMKYGSKGLCGKVQIIR